MRKSQIKVKLDQKQQCEAKNWAIEASLWELMKQNEFKDSIQEPYDANKLEELDFKSFYQTVCTIFYRWRLADIIKYLKYTSLVHTQHCLQNAEDDFWSDIDLFIASPHATIYPEIMTNFTLEVIALWKKIGKQALTRQIKIVETETNVVNINIPLQTFI